MNLLWMMLHRRGVSSLAIAREVLNRPKSATLLDLVCNLLDQDKLSIQCVTLYMDALLAARKALALATVLKDNSAMETLKETLMHVTKKLLSWNLGSRRISGRRVC